MARDLTQEPIFNIDDIQADILVGLIKKVERQIFFEITDPEDFKDFLSDLHITSMAEALAQRDAVKRRKAEGHDDLIPTPGLNIAFTFDGLHRLGVVELGETGEPAFEAGMAASQADLSDPPSRRWSILKPSDRLHGVFVLTGATPAEIADTISLRLAPSTNHGWAVRHEEHGAVRPSPTGGHEHFGFADGVSQPGVRGLVAVGQPLTESIADPDQGMPGQDLLWPGEFVFGYPGQDATADAFTVKGPVVEPALPFMRDGAFMVFRRLAQKVPEFHQAVKAAAADTGLDGSDPASADLLGAQLVGRWKSGAPLVKTSLQDDLTLAEGTGKENDFEFNDDRAGLKCPWAAHVRKAYPRDDVFGDLNPDEAAVKRAEAATQSHRMLRRGITFGPELTEAEALAGRTDRHRERGLLFKCYVTSIVDQFEFVQQSWANNSSFVQPGSGIDPIIGQSDQEADLFLGAAPLSLSGAAKPSLAFGRFVEFQGGAYFFAPSIAALRNLQPLVAEVSERLKEDMPAE